MKANEGRGRGKISHMISKYFISEVEIRGNAHMLQFISGRLISFWNLFIYVKITANILFISLFRNDLLTGVSKDGGIFQRL